MRVLIIEDDTSTVLLLTFLLEEFQCEIYTADNVVDAHTILQHSSPIDLVVLDILLPGPSGIELLSIIRDQYPQVKVLIVSAHLDHDQDLPDFVRDTPQLAKPFTLNEFREAVRALQSTAAP